MRIILSWAPICWFYSLQFYNDVIRDTSFSFSPSSTKALGGFEVKRHVPSVSGYVENNHFNNLFNHQGPPTRIHPRLTTKGSNNKRVRTLNQQFKSITSCSKSFYAPKAPTIGQMNIHSWNWIPSEYHSLREISYVADFLLKVI